ncbi:hypothetical protein Ddye_012492 [Dipteronia dyeriana]|uniref:MULE transposase domain-containing protein n=1 Tax=Dipteronia dyeriana TaxID=168575 RepID=A0AAD9X4G4_9ROSI|nr:hypothetical protein Ddye_012492 [Dipteronia dyeriana]
MEGGNYWTVQKFKEDYSCTIDDLHNCHRQASAWLAGEILSPKLVVSDRSLKPNEIMDDKQVTKTLRVKGLVEQNIFGLPDLSYQLLHAYCHELKRANHGIVTTIKKDADKKFEYLFIAFNASLVGFQTAISLAICIDATHLKGRFGGVIFIAACEDANNQVFPLAYGWGDAECEDSWTWFLKELKKAIGCPTNCIIISDRSPAIKVAMTKEYPEIPDDLCGFHMNMNLKNKFKSHVLYNLFHDSFKGTSTNRVLGKDLQRIIGLQEVTHYKYIIHSRQLQSSASSSSQYLL